MEIELYNKMLNPLDAINQVGEFFAKSGLFGCDRVEQGKVLAMACMAEGKSPLEIKRTYHIYAGELSMRADAMLAEFRRRGGMHEELKRTSDEASVRLTIEGVSKTYSFTFAEAQVEPFIYRKPDEKNPNAPKGLKKNWATPRARMQTLWARVISDGVRARCPEIVAGVYETSEAEDRMPDQPGQTIVMGPEPTAAAPMKSANPAPTVSTAASQQATPPAAPTVIDVSPKSPQAAPTVHMMPAPTVSTPPPPSAATAPVAAAVELATPEQLRELEVLVGPHADLAIQFFVQNRWLDAVAPSIARLTRKKVQKILAGKDAFLRAIGIPSTGQPEAGSAAPMAAPMAT